MPNMPRYSGENLKLVKKPYIGRGRKRYASAGDAKASVVGTRWAAKVVTPSGKPKQISRRGAPTYAARHSGSIQPIKQRNKPREMKLGTALTFKNPKYR